MYIIGCDNKSSVISQLEKILKNIDPFGEHRFYTDVQSLISDLDEPIEMAFIDVDMPEWTG